MSKVLTQITEDDVMKVLEAEQIVLADEELRELFDAIRNISTEDSVSNILHQYSEHKVKKQILVCSRCPSFADCPAGKEIMKEGLKALAMSGNIKTISGVN